MVNGGFLHYMDMKKFLKNLLRNCWSDLEIISHESEFDIRQCLDCLIRAVIATGKLPSPFVSRQASKIFGPLSSICFFFADTGSFFFFEI